MNITRDWILELYPFKWTSDPVLLEMKVRWSIFIITGVCAGLPALVWSVSDIIHHRKNGHRISIFIIILLLTDFLELFLSPYILIKLLLDELSWYTNWTVVWVLWSCSRACGLLLNKLVALEGFLSIKYPLCIASVFSSPCFRICYILVLLCIIVCHFYFQNCIFYVGLLLSYVLGFTWIILSGVLCCADHHTHTSRKSDHHIWVVFIFSLMIYFNYFVIIILKLSLHLSVQIIPFSLVSLRLISDPLLCVLVCRQNLSLQTSQKPEETSSVSEWED